MEEEIWKDIPGYENMYQASTLGRVKRLKRSYPVFQKGVSFIGNMPEIIMSPNKSKNGYCGIGIVVDGKCKTYTIHRLVALTFLENPLNKPEVDHINAIRDDNRVINLRWATREENQNNPITVENMKLSAYDREYKYSNKVVLVNSSTKKIDFQFKTVSEAGKIFNVSDPGVKYRCDKFLNKDGYYWMFAHDVIKFYST